MAITRDVVIKVRVDSPKMVGAAGSTAAARGGVAAAGVVSGATGVAATTGMGMGTGQVTSASLASTSAPQPQPRAPSSPAGVNNPAYLLTGTGAASVTGHLVRQGRVAGQGGVDPLLGVAHPAAVASRSLYGGYQTAGVGGYGVTSGGQLINPATGRPVASAASTAFLGGTGLAAGGRLLSGRGIRDPNELVTRPSIDVATGRSLAGNVDEATGAFGRLRRALGGANTAARQYNETLGRFTMEAARLLTWSRLVTRTTFAAESPQVTSALGGISGRMIAGQFMRMGTPVAAGMAAAGFATGQLGLPQGWGGRGVVASPYLRDPAGGRAFSDRMARMATLNLWRPEMEQDYLRQRNMEVLEEQRRIRAEAFSRAAVTVGRLEGPGRVALMEARLEGLRAQQPGDRIQAYQRRLGDIRTRQGTGENQGVYDNLQRGLEALAERSSEQRLRPYEREYNRIGRQIMLLQEEMLQEGPPIGMGAKRTYYELEPSEKTVRDLQATSTALEQFRRTTKTNLPWYYQGPASNRGITNPRYGGLIPEFGKQYTPEQFEQMTPFWRERLLKFDRGAGRAYTPEERQEQVQRMALLEQQRVDIGERRMQELQRIGEQTLEVKRQELQLAQQITEERRKETQDLRRSMEQSALQAFFTPRGMRRRMLRVEENILGAGRALEAGDIRQSDRDMLRIMLSRGTITPDAYDALMSAVTRDPELTRHGYTPADVEEARGRETRALDREIRTRGDFINKQEQNRRDLYKVLENIMRDGIEVQRNRDKSNEMAADRSDAPLHQP